MVFRGLGDAGLYQASHFSSGGRWKTITEFSDPTGPFRLDFLRSLQLFHFLRSIQPPADHSQPLTTLEEFCTEFGVLPHTLSLTYTLLNTPPAEYQPPGLIKWKRELNCQFSANKTISLDSHINRPSARKFRKPTTKFYQDGIEPRLYYTNSFPQHLTFVGIAREKEEPCCTFFGQVLGWRISGR